MVRLPRMEETNTVVLSGVDGLRSSPSAESKEPAESGRTEDIKASRCAPKDWVQNAFKLHGAGNGVGVVRLRAIRVANRATPLRMTGVEVDKVTSIGSYVDNVTSIKC